MLRAFLVWAFALSLAIYSWAGEKFAWLVLHPLLPLILLAGLGVQALWEARGTRLGQAALAVAAVARDLRPGGVVVGQRRAPRRPARAARLDAVLGGGQARGRRRSTAMARKQPKLTVTIDSADGATFPYAWYFRDLNVGYLDLTTVADAPGLRRAAS